MQRSHLRRQLPSQLLAFGMSAAYTVVAGIGGSVLVTPLGQERPAYYDTEDGSSYTTYSPSAEAPITRTPRLPPPAGSSTSSSPSPTTATLDFVTVSGGGGIVTEIPAEWQRQSRSATLTEAVDPADESRLLRYGGAPPTDRRPLLDRITDAARATSTHRSGYVLLRVDQVVFHHAEAVSWEFEYYDETGHNLHCSARYWMADGVEYVLYAQSLRSDWEDTEPVLARMVETAGPVA
jgi:hypothetical protein